MYAACRILCTLRDDGPLTGVLATSGALPVVAADSRVRPSVAKLLFLASPRRSCCAGRGRKQRHLQDWMSLKSCARVRLAGRAEAEAEGVVVVVGVVCEGSCLRSGRSRVAGAGDVERLRTSGSSRRKARSRWEEARSNKTLRTSQTQAAFTLRCVLLKHSSKPDCFHSGGDCQQSEFIYTTFEFIYTAP